MSNSYGSPQRDDQFFEASSVCRDLHAIACAVSPLSPSHPMNPLSCGKKRVGGHRNRGSKTLRCVCGRGRKSFRPREVKGP